MMGPEPDALAARPHALPPPDDEEVERFTVSLVPCLVGAGLPLFGGVRLESGLALESATCFKTGIAQLRYRVRPR